MRKPKKIYKYQAISQYSLRNLKNNQIYFNSPSNFNDPFDTFQEVLIKDMTSEEVKNLYFGAEPERSIFEHMETGQARLEEVAQIFSGFSESMGIPFKTKLFEILGLSKHEEIDISFDDLVKLVDSEDALQTAICQTLYNSINEIVSQSLKIIKQRGMFNASISCFSEEHDNMLMWSHYADGHKGFCLEFDTSHEPFTKMHKVKYSEGIPEIDAAKVWNRTENNMEAINGYLLSKHIDWQYEREWRVLHTEKTTSFRYNSSALIGIYFGTKIDFTDLEIVATVIRSQNPKCRFYEMDKLSGKFKVVPREVTYNTFIECKSAVKNQVWKYIIKGERNVDNLMEYVNLNISETRKKEIVESIVNDL